MRNPFRKKSVDPLKLREIEQIHLLVDLIAITSMLVESVKKLNDNINDLIIEIEELNPRRA